MSRHILIVGAAIAALSLGACSKKADETKGAATPAEQAATPDAHPAATVPSPANEAVATDFVPKAAASDMFEVQAAKLAQKMSKNAEVKKFAGEMIKAHTESTAGLKAAIKEAGVSIAPPDALPADLQGKLDDLSKAAAKDFDAKYAGDMVDAHQDALNIIQRYAQDGDVPAIKAFAAKIAPTVEQHLQMAKGLKTGMK